MDDDEGERLRHRVLSGKGVLLKQPDIGVRTHTSISSIGRLVQLEISILILWQ